MEKLWISSFMAVLAIGTIFTSVVLAELSEIDARQVAVNNDRQEDGDDATTDLEMTLINKRGQERKRKVISYRKDYGKDEKTVMFFKKPADVKDTGFLTWSYDDADTDDEQWLYLPALKKVRRISSSKKADYFMGTDFTYSDMGDRNTDDYDYKHLGTEVIDGIECYHIESTPKDKKTIKDTGYSRSEVWIRPDNWLMVKAKFYDKKGKYLKELLAGDIEEIDGIWTAKTMHMVNEQKNHQTIFTFSNHAYNTGLEDDIFSQRRLTKGVK
ncbi:MAG: outer membrane lipoprotein-sorting protein [bacterium]|nr:outer membrane lipoprotein-sorting protein [bacterium]